MLLNCSFYSYIVVISNLIEKVKVVPTLGVEETFIESPSNEQMFLLIERPKPKPPLLIYALSSSFPKFLNKFSKFFR